jgi:hypothetical protein
MTAKKAGIEGVHRMRSLPDVLAIAVEPPAQAGRLNQTA